MVIPNPLAVRYLKSAVQIAMTLEANGGATCICIVATIISTVHGSSLMHAHTRLYQGCKAKTNQAIQKYPKLMP